MPSDTERLISLSELIAMTGISQAGIYRRCNHASQKDGMPAPVKIGRRNLWRLSEIQAWMAELPRGA